MILKKTALLFSFILHPLFMPLFGIVIVLFSGSYVTLLPLAAKKMIILLFATGTLLLPAIMLPLAYFRGDILMQKQNDRNIPLVLSFIFYLITYVLFLKVPVYGFMHGFMLGAVASVFITLVINLRWKISMHMIGLGGLSAFLLIISITRQINLYPWLLISILASGIVGTSRLYLNSHSPAQIYVGYFVGCLTMFTSLLFFGY
jgi:hypothetical protein